MALQRQASIWLVNQILLEVAGQLDQGAFLAGQQSAVGVLDRRLGGWEVNAVQSQPDFQLDLLRRFLDFHFSSGVGRAAMPIIGVAVHDVVERPRGGIRCGV